MSQLPSHASEQPAGSDAPVFPCSGFPSVTHHARLLGVYPQRQPGRFMQRVRIPGGILSAGQWRALAGIARRFTPTTPLHLTTRQDLELHDLSDADVPQVQQLLADADLTSLGSGGDTFRNITICPCAAGGRADTADLLPLGLAIDQTLAACDGIFTLPRKFKISLGCQRGCGRPFIQDLAFVVTRRNGRLGLKVIGAGSLGAKPAPGIVLLDWIEGVEALPLSLATVRLFARHGDRQNRAKARLRHVRQRLGEEAFLAALRQEFEIARAERVWPKVELNVAGQIGATGVLTFPNGEVTPDEADALATIADTDSLAVRIGNDHRINVFADSELSIIDALARLPVLASRSARQSNVVACPGTRWCGRALADTPGLADRIRAALADRFGSSLCIAVSGCPNGCSASAVADIGVVGGRSIAAGQAVEKYAVLSGGGNGTTDILGQPVASGLSADQAVAAVISLAQAFAKRATKGMEAWYKAHPLGSNSPK